MVGLTTLFGSNPLLNAIKFKIVEHGIEIVSVRMMDNVGIIKNDSGGIKSSFKKK
jgi:hypothetical protein